MKARMHFDTLTYANKLKAAGMEPRLAEAQAFALVEAIDDGTATKEDFRALRVDLNTVASELRSELGQLRSELHSELGQLRSELHSELGQLRSELHSELGQLRSELHSEVGQLRSELQMETNQLAAKFPQLKAELIQWMIGLFITNITLVGAFIAFAQFLGRAH